jgi:transposase
LFLPAASPNGPHPDPHDSLEVAELKRQLHWAYLKIQVLEERLRLQRIQKYGPSSEKLSDTQLELLEWEPGISDWEVQTEGAREPLPADLPHVERVIGCTPEQCQCFHCGQPTTVIGYETSEQLDVEPAKYFVLVTKREKRACQHCEQGGVAAAPVPARIIEKGLVSDRW